MSPSAPKDDLLPGTLDLIVLKTLETLGPLHGYGITRRIRQVSADLDPAQSGVAVSRPPSTGTERVDPLGVGPHRHEARGALLQADSGRPPATGQGSQPVGSHGEPHDARDAGTWRGTVMREWAARFVAMFRKRSMRERLDRELALHRELLAEELAARGSGSTPDREMGSASFRDAYDDRAGVPWLEHLWGDLRYGVRAMRRAPTFSLVVILTLGLGIGVNTAIFSVVHGVLLKPLPYPGSERLVWLGETAGEATGISVTWPNFTSWRSENRSFEAMGAFQFGQLTLTGRGDARSIRGLIATPDYFALLGMQPLLGRLFTDQDDRPGAAATVVLNHGFWSGALGGDPRIVGAALTLDGQPYEVVGVAAPVWETRPVDYYLPLGRISGTGTNRSRHGSMPGDRPPEAGRHAAGGSRGPRYDHAAPGRGRSGPRERAPQLRRDPGRARDRRCAGHAAHADGRGGARPSHRVRERRKPAALARHVARHGVHHTSRDRRRPWPAGASAVHREHAHRRGRRRRRSASGLVDAASARRDGAAGHSAPGRNRARPSRSAVREHPVADHGDHLRSGASRHGESNRSHHGPQGRGPHSWRRRAAPVRAQRPRGRGNRPHVRPGIRRRAAAPEPHRRAERQLRCGRAADPLGAVSTARLELQEWRRDRSVLHAAGRRAAGDSRGARGQRCPLPAGRR